MTIPQNKIYLRPPIQNDIFSLNLKTATVLFMLEIVHFFSFVKQFPAGICTF